MFCDQMHDLLDRLMDGELSADQREEMTAHARECPQCAAEMRATLQMKALFDQMLPEADVPLQAQAKWRSAVREASRQRRRNRMIRWIGTAAAAVVVVAGVSLGIGGRLTPKEAPNAARMTVEEGSFDSAGALSDEMPYEASVVAQDYSGVEMAVIQSDGASEPVPAEDAGAAGMAIMAEAAEEAMMTDAALQTPPSACEFSIGVEDVGAACDRICDLAEEYESEAELQMTADGGAKLYMEIDAQNAADFLEAVARMDADGAADELPETNGEGRVLVLLWVNALE